jgi:hypothetical protein
MARVDMNIDGAWITLLAGPTENVRLVALEPDAVNYAGHWTRVGILTRCGNQRCKNQGREQRRLRERQVREKSLKNPGTIYVTLFCD